MSEATRKRVRGTGPESLVWTLARDNIHRDIRKRSGGKPRCPLSQLKFYMKGRNPKDVEVITCGEEK